MKVSLGTSTHAQVILDYENLVGIDLQKARMSLTESLKAGRDSLTIDLAEVLFYSGEYEQAFKMYQRADSLRLFSSMRQRRNFAHAARLINARSPYNRETGYFKKDWELNVEVRSFCGNSENEDIAAFKWNNWLFITSSRGESKNRYDFTQRPFLNIYAFEENQCKPSKFPRFLPRRIKSRWHDGPIAISADTNLVIISRNFGRPNERGVVNIFLEYFVRKNSRWSRPQAFPFASDYYSIQHPYYHDKEQTLYFSSNMPGGYGGFDLYKSRWNGNGWDSPVNLGPEINSPYDEVFPSFTPAGDLVYSSNHIETNGGLDIVLFKDGARTLFPAPVNTPYDDYAVFFIDENSGYLSSNRAGRAFSDNIYLFSIIEPVAVEHEFLARVIDTETGLPIEGATVVFSSEEKELSGEIMTDSDGSGFLFRSFPELESFSFITSSPGYKTLVVNAGQPLKVDSKFNIVFSLEREEITPPAFEDVIPTIIFESIVLYFDNDRPARPTAAQPGIQNYQVVYELYYNVRNEYYERSASAREDLEAFFREMDDGMNKLEALADFLYDQLKEGKRLLISLSAFASPIGTSEYNARLSERRNTSVRNYFESRNGGAFMPYIRNGSLLFSEVAFGETQAPAHVSASRTQRDKSVYSVEASRERRVTLSWKEDDRQLPVSITGETPESSAYYVIAGSFKSRRAAENFAATLMRRGATAPGILGPTPNGFYRVYYSRSQQLESALRDLEFVRRNVEPAAWIINGEGSSLHLEEIRGPENYIIAGSFRNMQGAEQLLNQLVRMGVSTAGILDRTAEGLYRVYYNRYHQPAQATRELASVRQSVAPDAWILSR